MKTRIAIVLVVLMSAAMLAGCVTTGKQDTATDMVRTDIKLWDGS